MPVGVGASTRIVGVGSYSNGDLVLVDGANNVVLSFFSGVFALLSPSPTFTTPTAVAVDLLNSVAYVADSGTGLIRAVTTGGVATTLASGLSSPTSLAFSASTATTGFSTSPAVLLYVGSGSAITTVTALGVTASLSTTAAPALSITALALSTSGTFFLLTESANNCVRKMMVGGGAVTAFAGSCGAASGVLDGAGTSARFASPGGLAFTSAGNALVSDTAGFTLRSLSPAGVVTTVAGLAGAQHSQDGAGAAARLYAPGALVVTPQDDAYLIDQPSGAFSQLRSLD